jgi:tetratricopeptide (TPR) repeat protein
VSINLQDAYIAVEHAYSMQQFPEALRLAQELVPRIPSGSEDQLDLRLQLLIGHTYLYGLGQPQKALPCYQQVLKQSYDPTYRELAEQGVTLCQQAGASASLVAIPEEAATSSSSGAAVPWLEDLGSLGTIDQLGHDSPGAQPGLAAGAAAAEPWAAKAGESVKGELVERIEPDLVELIEEPAPSLGPTGGLESPQAFSPAEAAELAKGLLRVVLN